ncbi:condensation domain-containing protein, partial [Streptomyces sp. SP17BM10]|uniref:condensation domain-containing protein n=1 Tax=Streptomyces sp. SP17BM10 TaxID=3002530 RepID=UPI002E7A4C25
VPATPGTALDTEALRTHIAAALPDYMVPSAFVPLEQLPLTVNGKLDRKQLPAPEFTGTARGRQPVGTAEEVLCGIFRDLLGLESVSVEDGFFELGGDSIVSIQLVSRARKAGLVFTARDVFTHRTPEALAAVATTADVLPTEEAGAGLGPVPETPIVGWLREVDGPIDGFNQAMLVRTPAAATFERLADALQTVLDHHDVLRARLVRGADAWNLDVPAAGAVRATDVLRRAEGADLAAEARAAQLRLAPDAGVMLQAVWFEDTARLLVMAHHLVVDGVTWRILLPDLAHAYEGTALEPVPTSFRRWAQQLTALDRSSELPLWHAQFDGYDGGDGGDAPLAVLDPAVHTAATARHLNLTLPSDVTTALLTDTAARFRATVNDVLLTAFALAVNAWRPGRGTGVLVDLEGHGRENVVEHADTTRTAGWFTSMFPVRLDPGAPGDPGRALKAVKEQLHALPDNGVGYGLLRYSTAGGALADAPRPQFGFNYLGRFAAAGEDTDWALCTDADLGDGRDPAMPLAHAVDLNAATLDTAEGPQLTADWSWPDGLLTEERVR